MKYFVKDGDFILILTSTLPLFIFLAIAFILSIILYYHTDSFEVFLLVFILLGGFEGVYHIFTNKLYETRAEKQTSAERKKYDKLRRDNSVF